MQRLHALRGFTLIELLVAISVLALMADLSWRGIDGMTRAQARLQQHATEVSALQAGLAQWSADLDALADLPETATLTWDGRTLRILRRSAIAPADGLLVVAWARRDGAQGGQWLRWQSPPLKTQGEVQLAWQKAALWAQSPGEDDHLREVALVPLDQWQLYYFRGDTWTHPLSSTGTGDAASTATATAVPDGIRLVLSLAAGQAISGQLTRDWVRPGVGGGK